jgi:hypothetical protein
MEQTQEPYENVDDLWYRGFNPMEKMNDVQTYEYLRNQSEQNFKLAELGFRYAYRLTAIGLVVGAVVWIANLLAV